MPYAGRFLRMCVEVLCFEEVCNFFVVHCNQVVRIRLHLFYINKYRCIMIKKIVLIILGLIYPCFVEASATKPNIILFLVDDMGLMDTSLPMLTDLLGKPQRHPLNDWYRTPNMVRLAGKGTRFTHFYAHSVCSPTRVSMMTGQNAARHRTTDWINPYINNKDVIGKKGANINNKHVPPKWNWEGLGSLQIATLPTILKEQGYTTIHVGKGHFSPAKHKGANPKDIGFDVNIGGAAIGRPGSYYGEKNYGKGGNHAVPHLEKYHGSDTFLTEALTAEAKGAVDNAVKGDKPFFLYMSHYAVHAPFNGDPRFVDHYTDKKKPAGARAYATLIEGMDKSLGDIMDHLQNKAIAKNTLIIFLGDNGGDAPLGSTEDISSSAPLRGRKGSKWEGGVRVPFIAAWAKQDTNNVWQKKMPIVVGAIRQEVGICYDIFPTILELVGAKVSGDHTVDGRDLTPLLSGQSNPKHQDEFLNHFPHTRRGKSSFYTTWRQKNWKVRYEYLAEGHNRYALYDLSKDPSESKNLALSNTQQLKGMMQAMVQQLNAMNALYPVKHEKALRPIIP